MKTYKIIYCLLFFLFFSKAEGHSQQSVENISNHIKEEKINFIQLLFSDIFGNLKSCTFTKHTIESILKNGATFDGSSIPGYATITKSDLTLAPDLNTFTILPWTEKKDKTAILLCDVYTSDQTPHPNCCRSLLKKIEQEAQYYGYKFYTSPELEFYLFKKTKQPTKKHLTKPDYIKLIDEKGYCESSEDDPTYLIKQEIINTLSEMGLEPEKFHHEVASSQHEITVKYDQALKTADNLLIVKKVIKHIATKHGLNVTYMPKPIFGENGSGMHINYSLFDINNNSNAFFDPEEKFYLSNIAKCFIAGNLKYVNDYTAILNPTINSYKRLVKGYEAPIYICWGSKNRSTLVRIPDNTKKNQFATRAEMRSPDPMCNPYLSFAVILKSGLDGILNKEKLSKEISKNLFTLNDQEICDDCIFSLPVSLQEAIETFRKSEFIKSLLGEELFYAYIKYKQKEICEFNTTVTDWELQKYL